jgi:hypothetical protein
MSFPQEIKATPEQIPLLISSWLDIHIIIGFLLQKKDIVEQLFYLKVNKVVYGQD